MQRWALGLMAIRQARMEPLALSASGHEGAVDGWAAASDVGFVSPASFNRGLWARLLRVLGS